MSGKCNCAIDRAEIFGRLASNSLTAFTVLRVTTTSVGRLLKSGVHLVQLVAWLLIAVFGVKYGLYRPERQRESNPWPVQPLNIGRTTYLIALFFEARHSIHRKGPQLPTGRIDTLHSSTYPRSVSAVRLTGWVSPKC